MLIAVGVNTQGIREILGFMIGDSESEESWNELFRWLKERGLHGVDLVVFDNHWRLVKAMYKDFQGATWQRCQTHFLRNIVGVCPKTCRDEIKSHVQAILHAPDIQTTRMLLSKTLDTFEKAAPRAMETFENGFDNNVIAG